MFLLVLGRYKHGPGCKADVAFTFHSASFKNITVFINKLIRIIRLTDYSKFACTFFSIWKSSYKNVTLTFFQALMENEDNRQLCTVIEARRLQHVETEITVVAYVLLHRGPMNRFPIDSGVTKRRCLNFSSGLFFLYTYLLTRKANNKLYIKLYNIIPLLFH